MVMLVVTRWKMTIISTVTIVTVTGQVFVHIRGPAVTFIVFPTILHRRIRIVVPHHVRFVKKVILQLSVHGKLWDFSSRIKVIAVTCFVVCSDNKVVFESDAGIVDRDNWVRRLCFDLLDSLSSDIKPED